MTWDNPFTAHLDEDGTFRIFINGAMDQQQRQFEFAHQLRRVLSYTNGSNTYWQCLGPDGRRDRDLDEVLADFFVYALVMPEAMVRAPMAAN